LFFLFSQRWRRDFLISGPPSSQSLFSPPVVSFGPVCHLWGSFILSIPNSNTNVFSFPYYPSPSVFDVLFCFPRLLEDAVPWSFLNVLGASLKKCLQGTPAKKREGFFESESKMKKGLLRVSPPFPFDPREEGVFPFILLPLCPPSLLAFYDLCPTPQISDFYVFLELQRGLGIFLHRPFLPQGFVARYPRPFLLASAKSLSSWRLPQFLSLLSRFPHPPSEEFFD